MSINQSINRSEVTASRIAAYDNASFVHTPNAVPIPITGIIHANGAPVGSTRSGARTMRALSLRIESVLRRGESYKGTGKVHRIIIPSGWAAKFLVSHPRMHQADSRQHFHMWGGDSRDRGRSDRGQDSREIGRRKGGLREQRARASVQSALVSRYRVPRVVLCQPTNRVMPSRLSLASLT